MRVLLNGPTAGTGYSQLNVNGEVDLDPTGAFLDASLGFIPAVGEQFTIINSTVPIVGTFDGLAEGGPLTIGSTQFTISYVGEDGNDVVLTAGVSAAPAVTSISPTSGPEPGGTPVTIIGTGFTGATEVDFGTTAATGLVVVDDTTITANSPAGTGTVDVTVITPAGTSPISAADQFTYTVAAAPTVTGISPTSGPETGGTSVTITGIGFTSATAVDFGTTAATGVVVVNDTIITANSPAGAGIVDVTVITPAGTSPISAADQFTYTVGAAPTVTGLSPSSGPSTGDSTVEITGTGFTGTTEVDFATTPVTGSGILVVNDTTILVNTPPGSGVVDVTVTTPEGTSAISPADQFTYTFVAGPTVTGLSPPSGPEAGGTPVIITGTGFTGATEVDFGTTAATSLFVNDDTTIEVISPAGTGTVDVTVITLAGTSPISAADQFTYIVAAAPIVTGISPSSGPAAGGTHVTITGTGFTGARAVDFGTTVATGLVVVNDTTITANSPTGTGTVNVTVITQAGTSPISAADQFNYTVVAAPTVTGISPTSGPAAGGTAVTITGTGFTGATAVDFGTTAATGLVVVNDTTITANSPTGTASVNVTVITPAGTSTISPADQFSYVAVLPRVVSLLRFGFHMQQTSLVLTFSAALDPRVAEDINNYQIVTMGGQGRSGNLVGHVIRINTASYDAATLTVTLFPAERLDLNNLYQLTVNGMSPKGLTGATGVPLDGKGNGVPGTNYVRIISGKLLAGPAPSMLAAARKRSVAHLRLKGSQASAVDALSVSGKLTAKLIADRRSDGHHHHGRKRGRS